MKRQRQQGTQDSALYTTAIHEAGHTVMSFLVQRGVKVVTIIPDEKSGTDGHMINTRWVNFEWLEDSGHKMPSKRILEKEMKIFIAGAVAVNLVFGDSVEWQDGASRDFDYLFGIIEEQERRKIKGKWDKPDFATDIEQTLNLLFERTEQELLHRINAVRVIADKLMERKTISGRLARKIFNSSASISPAVPETRKAE
jgi:ATP-dependent Zn protease